MAKKPRFYAVVKGRKPGIFDKWDGGARLSTDGFPGASYRGFSTLPLAEEWYRQASTGPQSLRSVVYHFRSEFEPTPSAPVSQPALEELSIAKQHIVYLIIDPETDEPFYVGETNDFERRKIAHLRSAQRQADLPAAKRSKRAAAKMAEILATGREPAFKAVEFYESKESALTAESAWVKRCAERGFRVWNRTYEHREIQELYRATESAGAMGQEVSFKLGPHSYASRTELKDKLAAFVDVAPLGWITHPLAIEKLRLLMGAAGGAEQDVQFKVRMGPSGRVIEFVSSGGGGELFDFEEAIERFVSPA